MLILLDRDGVLNLDRADYVKTPDELVLLAGAAAAVARLNAARHRVVVCTNQSAVGRGIIDAERLTLIHHRLREQIAAAGGHLDDILACTDAPDRPGPWRKPRPGMLLEAMRRFHATASETVMIGDHLRDLEAAAAAGCRRILVRTGQGSATQAAGLPPAVLPVAVHEDLAAAVTALLDPAP